MWMQQNVGDISAFLSQFRQRLLVQFQQEWSTSVATSERFEFYASFKTVIGTEKYFDYTQLRCFREAYTRFRFGISPIFVHKFRYKTNVTPRNLSCPVCKEEIEDESHVLFSCQAYNLFRREVPLLADLVDNDITRVMSADDEESVIQLSKFFAESI